MFAIYVEKGNIEDPLSTLIIGERPEPKIPEGWVRVKVTHASLNRHDIFTLLGITSHPEGISFPIILGNDGAGVLDDGTPVVLYPMMGSDDYKGDETLDPEWHIFSEFVDGSFADYIAVPRRNAIPLPEGLSPLHASVLGTAWLTAYRALFTKSGLEPGQTLLVQGASGGMSTAAIQMGRAAGFEVWATSRNAESRALAKKLGAHRVFESNETLPRKVDAIMNNTGLATFEHSMASVKAGGVIIITGGTTGFKVELDLMPLIANQISLVGSIMGTSSDMANMMRFIAASHIEPEIGEIVPMEQAQRAIGDMLAGKTHGKTVFTR